MAKCDIVFILLRDNRTKFLFLLLKSRPKKSQVVDKTCYFYRGCNEIFCLRVDFLGVYDLTFACLRVDFYFVYEYDILSTSRRVYESVCLRVDQNPLMGLGIN